MRGNAMEKEADFRWIEVSPDYRARLQSFECASPLKGSHPGSVRRHGFYYPPYEDEVQSVIRNFRQCDRDSQWAELAVMPGNDGSETIIAFVWFGILGGKKTDAEGVYTIGYIARPLRMQGCKMGRTTLEHALKVLKKDYEASHSRNGGPRKPMITARIDPDNANSITLFTNFGFKDLGEDEKSDGLPQIRQVRF
jgi:hypothetical protein